MSRRQLPLDRLQDCGSSTAGLSTAEVAQRRRYGFNDIVQPPSSGWRVLARDTARDPMLWFLLGTSALFGLLGDVAEAFTLLAAIVPLVGMDAYLHRRTRASTEGLASRLASTADALRDGAWTSIASRELVPGDLVRVRPGEFFAADGVIVGGHDLQVDESTLTGESLPVRKQPLATVDALPPTVSELHWSAAGTRLLTGEATLRVAYIGAETQYGKIVRVASQGSHEQTPMQLAIGQLVSVLLTAALILCLVLAGIRIKQGHGLVDAALSAVTLAVAAVPEEFPVVFTFFLGVGVYRLARRKALVRRAVAVENIGRITCICCDKTGTITAGELVLAHRIPAHGVDDATMLRLVACAARPESSDPLDTALAAALPAGHDCGIRQAVFPFTEQRRRETAVWRRSAGDLLAVTKGAPETVLAMCDLAPGLARQWSAQVDDYASKGHKVIACAARALPDDAWAGGEPDRGYALVGLLAFEDPVREGVREAVAQCLAAGIRVIMVTGDHPATALTIAREIGLGGERPRVVVLEGEGGDGEVRVDVDVVARAAPSRKLELVRALQAGGEVVAVTGDGVNDVPALQAADIGIAMGERGTRSAREIASIVLLDDNFRTIVNAIAEGRQLFRNLRLSFAYLLMVHIPLVISAAAVPLMGAPLLYLPIHIVWLELLIHPTAMLAFQDLPDRGRLEPVDRHAGRRFFSTRAWLTIALVGALMTLAMVWGYDMALGTARDVEHARAMAIATLVIASAAIAARLTGLRTAAARVIVLANLLSLALLVQWPVAAQLLHLRPLHLGDWGVVAAGGLLAGLVAGGVVGPSRVMVARARSARLA